MKSFYSAADLVKRSACQIKYLKYKKRSIVASARANEGVEDQLKNSKSDFLEMRGQVKLGRSIVNFCHDEVDKKKKLFIEHKMISDGSPEWLFHSSLLQVAFYRALSLNCKKYTTANFFVNQGHPMQRLFIRNPEEYKSILVYGKDKYRVDCSDEGEYILDYYSEKIRAIEDTDWDAAKMWDAEYKFLDWVNLKDYIIYKNV